MIQRSMTADVLLVSLPKWGTGTCSRGLHLDREKSYSQRHCAYAWLSRLFSPTSKFPKALNSIHAGSGRSSKTKQVITSAFRVLHICSHGHQLRAGPSPKLGQHSEEVLRDLLGDCNEIENLREAGIA